MFIAPCHPRKLVKKVATMSSGDLLSLANSIRDSDVKFIFRKLAKRNENEMKTALSQFIDLIPTLPYETTFTELIGHICVLFDHLLYDSSVSVRVLIVRVMGITIARLQKDVSGYANLIFPTLLLYLNDPEMAVSNEAKSVFDASFATPERKGKVMIVFQSEICQKIQSILNSSPVQSISMAAVGTPVSWGSVATSAISLACHLLLGIKMNRTLNEMLAGIRVFDWLRTNDEGFMEAAQPRLRAASYRLLSLTSRIGKAMWERPQDVLTLLRSEESQVAQPMLLKLLVELLSGNLLTREEVQPVFIDSISLYVDPAVSGFVEFFEAISDADVLCRCLDKVVLRSGRQAMFDFLISQGPPTDYRMRLFGRMTNVGPDSDFLGSCPLDCFADLVTEPSFTSVIISASESRFLDFLPFVQPDHVLAWLRARDHVSPLCLLQVCTQFGTDLIRSIYPTLASIPWEGTEPLTTFAAFLAAFVDADEFLSLFTDHLEVVPSVLRNWKRDFSILRSRRMLRESASLLGKDLGLVEPLKAIFPDDPEIADLIIATVAGSPASVADPSSSLLDHYSPDDDFLFSFLMSPAAAKLAPDHPLVALLTDFIPRAAARRSSVELARAITTFVSALNIDPTTVLIANNEIYYEYWLFFGFSRTDPVQFCHFLDSFLMKKVPWIQVLLYVRDVNWVFVPPRLWEFLGESPGLAAVAHSEGLLIALACICAANNLKIEDLPLDSMTLSAMPQLEPPPTAFSDRLGQIIQMEWNQIRPRAPDFTGDDDLVLALRQTIVYLRFFLPTLMVFDRVYNLLIRAFEHLDRVSFFYCVRILALISDATKSIPSLQFLQQLSQHLAEFSPFFGIVEQELTAAFRIGLCLTPEEFTSFMISSTQVLSPQLVRLVVPLIQYFNGWDLLDNELKEHLDVRNASNWYFVTSCLNEMPPRKRIQYVPTFAVRARALLDSLSPRSREFELIALSFPVTVCDWFEGVDFSKRQGIVTEVEKRVAWKAFKTLSKNIHRLKLEKTALRTAPQQLIIGVMYKEDPDSVAINLELKLPSLYPLQPITVTADFNDADLSKQCENQIRVALIAEESVEAGVRAWHAFVVSRVEAGHPCTICYQYFGDNRQPPNVLCGTCGNGFHRKCLTKWFQRCIRPTCPFCACDWRRAT
jgi:hypothetical protein